MGLRYAIRADAKAASYDFERRLNGNNADYAVGMRAYAGTQNVSVYDIHGYFALSEVG
jgi:hypothetical protein